VKMQHKKFLLKIIFINICSKNNSQKKHFRPGGKPKAAASLYMSLLAPFHANHGHIEKETIRITNLYYFFGRASPKYKDWHIFLNTKEVRT